MPAGGELAAVFGLLETIALLGLPPFAGHRVCKSASGVE